MDLNQARFNMIEQQIRPWEVLDPQVLALLSTVRREDFVPLAHKVLAFVDMEIPLGTLPHQVMLAPRVLIRDPVTGAPIAAKPDFSGTV
jgi:protein-L-isoaspartate(D-aspartate) O-methyltransferase